jgi:hypothetical protein
MKSPQTGRKAGSAACRCLGGLGARKDAKPVLGSASVPRPDGNADRPFAAPPVTLSAAHCLVHERYWHRQSAMY